jgi:hypothetical protein
MKYQLASLVLLGKRNNQIARALGVSSKTVRLWLRHPEVQETIRELEAELHGSTERLLASLCRESIIRMRKIIRHGEGKLALRAIELLLLHGPLSAQNAGDTRHIVPQPRFILDRADARAALSLLRQERERQEREKRAMVEQRVQGAE